MDNQKFDFTRVADKAKEIARLIEALNPSEQEASIKLAEIYTGAIRSDRYLAELSDSRSVALAGPA